MPDIQSIRFHKIVEAEAEHISYGTLTFTVILKNAIPIISTLTVVRQKRRKYKEGKRI